jgi:hypothetical protein
MKKEKSSRPFEVYLPINGKPLDPLWKLIWRNFSEIQQFPE